MNLFDLSLEKNSYTYIIYDFIIDWNTYSFFFCLFQSIIDISLIVEYGLYRQQCSID